MSTIVPQNHQWAPTDYQEYFILDTNKCQLFPHGEPLEPKFNDSYFLRDPNAMDYFMHKKLRYVERY